MHTHLARNILISVARVSIVIFVTKLALTELLPLAFYQSGPPSSLVLALLGFCLIPVYGFIGSVLTAMIYQTLAHDRRFSLMSWLKTGWERGWSASLGLFVYGLAMFGVAMLGVGLTKIIGVSKFIMVSYLIMGIMGAIMTVLMLLVPPLIVVEGYSVTEALKKSQTLIRGFRGRAMLYLIGIGIINVAIAIWLDGGSFMPIADVLFTAIYIVFPTIFYVMTKGGSAVIDDDMVSAFD